MGADERIQHSKYAERVATPTPLYRLAYRSVRDRGPRHAAAAARRAALAAARRRALPAMRYCEWVARRARGPRRFTFAGDEYRCFEHPYNATWRNERAVEIPIALRSIERSRGGRVLELGNVLGHYVTHSHEVVDKYERAPGVVNVDMLAFRPEHRYDLIVSISTLEHVGWDEEVRDPAKIPRAVAHMRSLLAPGGRAIVTLPLGYNPHLDDLLSTGALDFDAVRALRRTGREQWREIASHDIGRPLYGHPFPGANVLVVGLLERPR